MLQLHGLPQLHEPLQLHGVLPLHPFDQTVQPDVGGFLWSTPDSLEGGNPPPVTSVEVTGWIPKKSKTTSRISISFAMIKARETPARKRKRGF
jgi:hypothetical protein